jgi:hypothetical protein
VRHVRLTVNSQLTIVRGQRRLEGTLQRLRTPYEFW